mmetsp:Transcript_99013/g.285722  ORF Transcript_99013/g.285722 Transcript_99013/m.285722 type:complete len:324 (-) Transcript_99013:88-1059(-)|eukprot:CAMPEP_0176166144 /NCGR_PEP_ID=MMETSP0120_2-20121206/84971_1 /TAXON_ID=160619 /ORGANISM="Kryptoperidinium foliaceum, Strain CCMP 1326" /LENGTH=323 /DNA_ID=CAMNT_0017503675 /DNA_START=29 /DNA_END=1000 /DNA_ORIENTATION=+
MKTTPISRQSLLALYLLAAPLATNGFLAPNPNSKHVRVATNTVPVAPPVTGLSTSTPTARPATALQANLFDRFFRVARGNLNSILSQFEDPEKVMNQALVDMQNDITRVRQTYAEVTATQRRLLSQKTQYESVADDWYRRAQLALKSNNEGLAREALARREQALQKANEFQQQVDSQAANLDKLYEGMKALEGKILEAQNKKSELAARAKTAKSTAWVNDMLSGLSGRTSMDAFRRMEDKVAALEASAEVSAEMLNSALFTGPSKKDGKMDVELEFRRLEASSAVDEELEKMKAKMLPAGSSAIKSEVRMPAISEPLKVPILN